MQKGEGTTEGRRLPSPAMILAVAALIAALAGTAVAVDKITSKDIAKNAVRGKHIKDGQVKPKDTDVTKSRFASGLEVGNNVDLNELGLSVKVKRGDLVSVHGFAVARDAAGMGGEPCRFFLRASAPGIPENPQDVVLRFDSDAFVRRSFDGTGVGAQFYEDATAVEYLVPANGRFRVTPAFVGFAPFTECEIRDRGLSVTVER